MVPGSAVHGSTVNLLLLPRDSWDFVFNREPLNLFNLFLFFFLFRHLTGVSESGGNAEPGQNPRLKRVPGDDAHKQQQYGFDHKALFPCSEILNGAS
jgi:hypothetical protein